MIAHCNYDSEAEVTQLSAHRWWQDQSEETNTKICNTETFNHVAD